MKFLVDMMLSTEVAERLRGTQDTMPCVRASTACSALDEEILVRAASEQRILLSADTDFAFLLASRQHSSPSVVLLRRPAFHGAEFVAALLLANLPQRAEALEQGSLVVLEESRIRVRRLPITPP